MKTSSAKAKGRRLQQKIASKILEKFPKLTSRDVASVSMGVSGEDIKLSESASKFFPYSVEAKCQEKLSIWSALEQCEGNNRNLTPILVFQRNRSKIYVALEFDNFLKLLGDKNGE